MRMSLCHKVWVLMAVRWTEQQQRRITNQGIRNSCQGASSSTLRKELSSLKSEVGMFYDGMTALAEY
jgi:hypothetical protein